MFSIDLECTQDQKEILIADVWEAGCTGIVELSDSDETAHVRVFFDDDARKAELQARFGGEPAPADIRDWVAFAHEYLKPMLIGEKIFVCPEWRDDPTPEGRIRIVVNAGLAFGTGAHETTRLCLEAIERNLQPGMTLLDVGTGSGILAEAAFKLGAGRVLACDNDPEAVTVAAENFEKAGVGIELSGDPVENYEAGLADLVVANISPAWISDLAGEWVRVLKPGGAFLACDNVAFGLCRSPEQLARAHAIPLTETPFEHYRNADAPEAAAAVIAAVPGGFRVDRVQPVGPGTSNQWFLRATRLN